MPSSVRYLCHDELLPSLGLGAPEAAAVAPAAAPSLCSLVSTGRAREDSVATVAVNAAVAAAARSTVTEGMTAKVSCESSCVEAPLERGRLFGGNPSGGGGPSLSGGGALGGGSNFQDPVLAPCICGGGGGGC